MDENIKVFKHFDNLEVISFKIYLVGFQINTLLFLDDKRKRNLVKEQCLMILQDMTKTLL